MDEKEGARVMGEGFCAIDVKRAIRSLLSCRCGKGSHLRSCPAYYRSDVWMLFCKYFPVCPECEFVSAAIRKTAIEIYKRCVDCETLHFMDPLPPDIEELKP